MQTRLLAIDDAIDHQQILSHLFSRQYALTQAFTLSEADNELARNSFDLILLDLQLPDGDGFSYFGKLQSQEHTREIPVVFLTSSGEAPKEIMGLTLGAEDYIVKPIDPARLRARVEAKIRQLGSRRTREMVLQRGNLKLVVSLQRASLIQNGKETPISLTQVEFKLLFHFLRYEDVVFTREQLLMAAWGDASRVYDRTVDMHISNIRKKIADSDYEIQSVHGVGYRFSRKES